MKTVPQFRLFPDCAPRAGRFIMHHPFADGAAVDWYYSIIFDSVSVVYTDFGNIHPVPTTHPVAVAIAKLYRELRHDFARQYGRLTEEQRDEAGPHLVERLIGEILKRKVIETFGEETGWQ